MYLLYIYVRTEVNCKECNNAGYCNSCFKVFHSMGRKRKHRHSKVMEQLEYGEDYCRSCTRRRGVVVCVNIGKSHRDNSDMSYRGVVCLYCILCPMCSR